MLERPSSRRIARTNSRRDFTARRTPEHVTTAAISSSSGNDSLGRSQSHARLAAVVKFDAPPLERVLELLEGVFSGRGPSALEKLDRVFVHPSGSGQLRLGDFEEAAGRFNVLWE